MDTERIIAAFVTAILAAIQLHIAYRQHKEVGYIFTNTWVAASKEERERMDEKVKKAEYRLARNAFFMCGLSFLLLVIFILTYIAWFIYLTFILMAAVIIYAIAQAVKGEKENNKKVGI